MYTSATRCYFLRLLQCFFDRVNSGRISIILTNWSRNFKKIVVVQELQVDVFLLTTKSSISTRVSSFWNLFNVPTCTCNVCCHPGLAICCLTSQREHHLRTCQPLSHVDSSLRLFSHSVNQNSALTCEYSTIWNCFPTCSWNKWFDNISSDLITLAASFCE